ASAQRLLALEEQLLQDVAPDSETLSGTLELGASTGPGGSVVPVLLCEFADANPDIHVRLSVSDTQNVVDQVAGRELELGIVGAARRHRGVVFEPFFRDEVVLACPAGHRFAGETVTLDDLRSERLLVVQVELGLQESVRSAVAGGQGVTFISRSALDADLAAGTIVTARVEGLDP